jgi:type IV secretory pathway VirB10-like protein
MQKVSVINLFLKADNTGKRNPTVLTWILLCLLVFSSYFLSQNKKPVKKKKELPKESIIKERDIVNAAHSSDKNGDIFKIDYSDIVNQDDQKSQTEGLPKPKKAFRPRSTSKMIVFDGTKDYQSEAIVPLGSMVRCILIHNIVTNNFNAPVIAQVWKDFYFNGELLLPFGTRIYGTAFAGRERDRVTVKFHNIVFQDGKTLKIDAIGLSKDGSGGLTGTVIDNHNKKIFIEMAMNFLSGLAAGLQQTATNAVTGLSEVESNSRNAILNGVANTFEKEAKRIQKEAEDAKGYAVILAGNELVVYFEKGSDVNPL